MSFHAGLLLPVDKRLQAFGAMHPSRYNTADSQFLDASNMSEQTDWPAVVGRALAQFSLDAGPAKDGSIAEKARFLDALGLSRPDIAAMLNSTAASVTELLRQARGKKKAKKNGGKKKRK